MKNNTKNLIGLGAIAVLLTGCTSVQTQRGTTGFERPHATPEQEAIIVRSDIPVRVVEKGTTSTDVKALVASELAQVGFAVNDAAPYLTVALNTKMNPFDSFGNYHVYEGGCFISVTRDDTQVLLKKQIRKKGSRELEKGRALDAAEDLLAPEVAKEVIRVCTEKTTGVSSVIVTLTGYSDAKALQFSSKIRKKSGILSCRRIDEGKKFYKYRIIYNATHHTDGIQTIVRNAAGK